MAAGRHGNCHENEFKDHESNLEVTRRGFSNSKEYDPVRSGGHDGVRSGGIDSRDRDRIRSRQRDVRERDGVTNGSYGSFSSRSDSGTSGSLGPRRCGFSVKTVDREPGELSSESGSDGAVESESVVKDCEIAMFEGNRSRSPAP
ncbi:cyclin-dependent kinase G-2-like, partial [Trifolium medium]|nr:cyclin-dependent kinase G-2-like [Trifolium medium]